MRPVPRKSDDPAAGDKRRSSRLQTSQSEEGATCPLRKRAASASASEPAGGSCAASVDRGLPDVESGPCGSATLAERAEDDRHISGKASTRAIPQHPTQLRSLVVLRLPARSLTIGVQFAAGAIKLPYDMPEALRALARRVRSLPDGDSESSPPPQLLGELTNGVVVVVSEAVAAVAAEATLRVAGRARYRLQRRRWRTLAARRGGSQRARPYGWQAARDTGTARARGHIMCKAVCACMDSVVDLRRPKRFLWL